MSSPVPSEIKSSSDGEITHSRIPPSTSETLIFTLTKDSVFNTIMTSPDIIYEVVTSGPLLHRITTFNRIDRASGEKRFAGEIAWGLTTMVRVGPTGIEWVKEREWLRNEKTRKLSTARSFIGTFGVKYRWKTRRTRLHMTVHDDPTNPEESQPSLASFHRFKHNVRLQITRPGYLEVSRSVLPSLDYIIVSFIIREKRRRDD